MANSYWCQRKNFSLSKRYRTQVQRN